MKRSGGRSNDANQFIGLTYKRNGITRGNLTYGYEAVGQDRPHAST